VVVVKRGGIVDLARIQAFFFRAMVEGWAVGGQKIQIPDMPGYKAIPFRDGDFFLLDCYCVTPHSSMSAGTTTIWHRDVPVWVMHYGGFYEEDAIAFLKRALSMTYQVGEFVGGRGPNVFVRDSMVYVNRPYPNDFAKFEGREEVLIAESGISLGFHEYWGISLL